MNKNFQNTLKHDLDAYLTLQQSRFPADEVLRMDLHCHDYNSDVPDEIIGRILQVPETWLPSEKLIEKLDTNGCNAFTVTNHNNARSCYELQDKGIDILTAAEFSCWVPDFEVGIHVLAYGFTPEQESKLNKLRKNVYSFQEFTHYHNIPTIWAHPLYNYSVRQMPDPAFFRKMLLLFERFETLNGQRDTWQNMLVKEWIEQVDEEMIADYAKQYDVDPNLYCVYPARKVLTGGSDCHMGLFAGMTGSLLYVPQLQDRLKDTSVSALALEAIRKGQIAPYGVHQNSEKLTIAFLNYVCQIALNYKDPGLVRLLLHKGNTTEKITSLIASNLFSEVQRHKVTMSFIKLFYNCMMGKSPSSLKRFLMPAVYKPVFDKAVELAEGHKGTGIYQVDSYYQSILTINQQLNKILSQRLEKKIGDYIPKDDREEISLDDFISHLELPTEIRSYLGEGEEKQSLDIAGFLDGLSFPFFSSLFILAAHFTSAKVMYNTRPFLKRFSKLLGKYEQPKRILWLTDTFGDKNGVSLFLKEMHEQIKKRNLPIDILICNPHVQEDDHLVVLKPVGTFTIPAYKEQTFCVPDFVKLHNTFLEGEYDRIICSTEGIMGLCALYLKHAYTVETTFYMHTDWLMFARKVLHIKGHNLNRVRRLFRFFYKSFDKVLVLNSDQKKWLTGTQMNLKPEQVWQTAHWANERFSLRAPDKEKYFGLTQDSFVLLYVGRVSYEKGIMELPEIYSIIKEKNKNVQLVIAGKGPALEELKQKLPEAYYTGWIDQNDLPGIYSSADLLLLPSRFDTFCNVVLESLSCGLPVIAYNCKGPKDIIRHGKSGFLVESKEDMAETTIAYIENKKQKSYREEAVKRASSYQANIIIGDLMESVGMYDE